MSYLLDTNVVAEVRRPRPDAGVMAWFDSVRADVFEKCSSTCRSCTAIGSCR